MIYLKNIQPLVIWFTGLSGSGKTTLAKHLENDLKNLGCKTYLIDGDILREDMQHDLGFSKMDRSTNIARATQLALEKLQEGFIVIVALTSPFIKDRSIARLSIGPSRFKEIYVSTPLHECEKRDPKGLYQKSRQGLISHMVGIDLPYEPPLNANITINTATEPLGQTINRILLDLQIN